MQASLYPLRIFERRALAPRQKARSRHILYHHPRSCPASSEKDPFVVRGTPLEAHCLFSLLLFRVSSFSAPAEKPRPLS